MANLTNQSSNSIMRTGKIDFGASHKKDLQQHLSSTNSANTPATFPAKIAPQGQTMTVLNKADLRDLVARPGCQQSANGLEAQTDVNQKIVKNAITNCRTAVMQISAAENMLQQQQELGKPNSFEAIAAKDQMDKAVKQLKQFEPALRSGDNKAFAGAEAVIRLSKAIEQRNGSATSTPLGGGSLDFTVRKELIAAQVKLNSIK
jgi:hypothetical protein